MPRISPFDIFFNFNTINGVCCPSMAVKMYACADRFAPAA
jgi:hypothetical protein